MLQGIGIGQHIPMQLPHYTAVSGYLCHTSREKAAYRSESRKFISLPRIFPYNPFPLSTSFPVPICPTTTTSATYNRLFPISTTCHEQQRGSIGLAQVAFSCWKRRGERGDETTDKPSRASLSARCHHRPYPNLHAYISSICT